MPRDAYVNGRFVRHGEASIHIEDRGYQFADGVYEVVTILDSAFIDEEAHLARLNYSLGELRIAPPLGGRALALVMRALARRNGVRNGLLYLQITRGVAPRDFKFPKRATAAIVMTTRRQPIQALTAALDAGVAVITGPDLRWSRRDIKSIGLLAQVLAKQAAVEAGAYETWMVDPEGFVTEGASSNAWILNKAGVIATHPKTHSILHGVTGNAIERLAGELGVTVERRAFSLAEVADAREAFLTSATNFCVPVVRIDGKPVGDGRPGEVTLRLRRLYLEYARERQDSAFPWRP